MSEAKTEKPRVPAVEGWFTMSDPPTLTGTRCTACKTVFFPRETVACRNPACRSTSFDEYALSRRGKLWSYTTAHYQPPPPYIAPDPFVPYSIAVVELEAEQMTVLGQVPASVPAESLVVGMEMELVVEKLYEDEQNEYVVWKWTPVADDATRPASGGAQ
ncbi:MAG: OB-fold domain-containing protein [Myxococcales bacterium]|nr:OB-fold domain-containing protein [Myxococcales bacterium]